MDAPLDSPDATDPSPRLLREPGEGGRVRARLEGDWTLLALRERVEALRGELGEVPTANVSWDLSAVRRLDPTGALLLWQAWGRRQPEDLRWPQAPMKDMFQALFARLGSKQGKPARPPRIQNVRQFGQGLLNLASHLLDAVALLGQVTRDLGTLARHPNLIAWKDISAHLYRSGAQALGITALVGVLVGITLSYLTAKQLQSYGADIYVINILGISVWRELGPLLAAILVAGRSGSAMTAQLGVMRVTQELDALSVMGISHTIRLVLPKMAALALSLPLVMTWTSCMVLLGGMVAARATLGLDYVQFLQGLPAAVPVANLWLGLSKSAVFGLMIAFVACHFGLRIKPNSESLGTGTTDSVVSAITVVIIVDAIFAVMFSDVGLKQ
ncbi:phospholipid/cholesterol/gamma-HCH transport system permease protein [Mitsuaria sp. BK045]|uniref:ABC transporter permease n=1 Tax=unclassified Roseateles TaxID=2626991 RepID=UPI0016120572|nr:MULTISPECIES: ABC transporter permease [unclassified Roseateles]MBB3292290.1 phospholipid/cholesterol/gamma-HCH transport system permease protein [Mitsuaria sp. BK041]MBB3361508.1 phospholipid/cholesterol/gamma-HCH transport system permease protein [Mitsuaria sp. BK045]